MNSGGGGSTVHEYTYGLNVGIGQSVAVESLGFPNKNMATRLQSVLVKELRGGEIPKARITGQFLLSEGIWLDDGTHTDNSARRGTFIETYVEPSTGIVKAIETTLVLPTTLTALTSVTIGHAGDPSTLVLETTSPHYLEYLAVWNSSYPLFIVGISFPAFTQAALWWRIVDDTHVALTFSSLEGIVAPSAVDGCYLFMPPMLPDTLSSFLAKSMSTAAIAHGSKSGFQYSIEYTPEPRIAFRSSSVVSDTAAKVDLLARTSPFSSYNANEISLWKLFGFLRGGAGGSSQQLPATGIRDAMGAIVNLQRVEDGAQGQTIGSALTRPQLNTDISATLTSAISSTVRTIILPSSLLYTTETISIAWERQAAGLSTLVYDFLRSSWSLTLAPGVTLSFSDSPVRAAFVALTGIEIEGGGVSSPSTTSSTYRSAIPIPQAVTPNGIILTGTYGMSEDGTTLTIGSTDDDSSWLSGSIVVAEEEAATTTVHFEGGHRFQQGCVMVAQGIGLFYVETILSETDVTISTVITDHLTTVLARPYFPSQVAVVGTRGLPFFYATDGTWTYGTPPSLVDASITSTTVPPLSQTVYAVIQTNSLSLLGGAFMPDSNNTGRMRPVAAVLCPLPENDSIYGNISDKAIVQFVPMGTAGRTSQDDAGAQFSVLLYNYKGWPLDVADCQALALELILTVVHAPLMPAFPVRM